MDNQIVTKLCEDSVAICDGFISRENLTQLNRDFSNRLATGQFHRAGVGRAETHRIEDSIRRDAVAWIEPDGVLLEKLQKVRLLLNETLFLGLWDFEGHYAVYPPGAFYQKHFDRFSQENSRTVSFVLYLNEAWSPDDGGELVLYLPTGIKRVLPEPGRLVLFLSAEIEHEVAIAHRERRSFTGWFRKRR